MCPLLQMALVRGLTAVGVCINRLYIATCATAGAAECFTDFPKYRPCRHRQQPVDNYNLIKAM